MMMQRRTALKLIGARTSDVWKDTRYQSSGLLPTIPTLDILRYLDYACEGEKLSLIVGEYGLGKTECAALYAEKNEHAVYVESPDARRERPGTLMRLIAGAVGINAERNCSLEALRNQISQVVRDQGTTIIIDEACRLSSRHLEWVRMIHDPHPSWGILGHAGICLLGGPQLEACVARNEAFASRVGYARVLRPLTQREVAELFSPFPETVHRAAYRATNGKMRRLLILVEKIGETMDKNRLKPRDMTGDEIESIARDYLVPIAA